MTYTDIEYIKDLNVSIYDLLNKKADYKSVNSFLSNKVIKSYILIWFMIELSLRKTIWNVNQKYTRQRLYKQHRYPHKTF